MKREELEEYLEKRIRDLRKMNNPKQDRYLEGQIDALESVATIMWMLVK